MTAEEDRQNQLRILRFWLGDDPSDPAQITSKQKIWYASSDAIDREIKSEFGALHESAANETLLHWAEEPSGALALVIMLDQFSRNLFRGTVNAYAQDPMARAVAKRAYNRGFNQDISVPAQVFLLHPFHHSEELADQLFGVDRLRELIEGGHAKWGKLLESSLDWFEGHRDIVQRFGRFPHRNETLGRESTEKELAFLEGSSHFGQ